MDKEDVFLNRKIYPNAKDIFNMGLLPIEEVHKDCIYVVDTNALLVPYSTSSSGFDEITKAFTTLIEQKKLLIPGQVAREFAKNRPEKIKTLFSQLIQIKGKIYKPNTGNYPLLEKIEEYKEALEIQDKVIAAQKEYSLKISGILDRIKDWTWNDPVSEVYNRLFNEEVIYDDEIDEDEIIKDLEFRNKHHIPPGFKDKSKADHGVGDLLVWNSIIKIANERNKNIIFVSGDEKTDWFYRSESQSLYPRFELLTEFKHKTNNRSFHILKLSELLEHLGAEDSIVKEVERKETVRKRSHQDMMEFFRNAEESVRLWLYSKYEDSEIFENRGYPDFKIQLKDHVLGVEVMSIRGGGRILSPMHRLSERVHRSYYEIAEGEYDEILHIIVCETEDIAKSGEVEVRLQRVEEKFQNEFLLFKVGHLSDTGEFIEN